MLIRRFLSLPFLYIGYTQFGKPSWAGMGVNQVCLTIVKISPEKAVAALPTKTLFPSEIFRGKNTECHLNPNVVTLNSSGIKINRKTATMQRFVTGS